MFKNWEAISQCSNPALRNTLISVGQGTDDYLQLEHYFPEYFQEDRLVLSEKALLNEFTILARKEGILEALSMLRSRKIPFESLYFEGSWSGTTSWKSYYKSDCSQSFYSTKEVAGGLVVSSAHDPSAYLILFNRIDLNKTFQTRSHDLVLVPYELFVE